MLAARNRAREAVREFETAIPGLVEAHDLEAAVIASSGCPTPCPTLGDLRFRRAADDAGGPGARASVRRLPPSRPSAYRRPSPTTTTDRRGPWRLLDRAATRLRPASADELPVWARGLRGRARCALGDAGGLDDIREAVRARGGAGSPRATRRPSSTSWPGRSSRSRVPPRPSTRLRACIELWRRSHMEGLVERRPLPRGPQPLLDGAVGRRAGRSARPGARAGGGGGCLGPGDRPLRLEPRAAGSRRLGARRPPGRSSALRGGSRQPHPRRLGRVPRRGRRGAARASATRRVCGAAGGVRGRPARQGRDAVRLPAADGGAHGAVAVGRRGPRPSPGGRASIPCCRSRARVERTLAAQLLELDGELSAAATAYERAARGWRGFSMPFEEAHAWLAAGRCLAELGEAGRAADALRRAAALFEGLGAAPALGEVDDV